MKFFNREKTNRPNKQNILNKETGRKLFVGVMYTTFISATIISAIINILMFTQLSQELYEKLLFLAISITLEGTKVFTVIKASMLRSIGIKIDQANLLENKEKNIFGKVKPNKATNSSKMFFRLYLIFAFIAIFASLGLSLSITNKSISTTSQATERSTLVINTATNENVGYNKELADLKFEDKEKAYKSALKDSDAFDIKLTDLNIAYQKSDWKDADVAAEIKTTKAKQKALHLADKKIEYDAALAKYNELTAAIKANDTKISSTKLSAIDTKTTNVEAEGTSNMFSLMADTFVIVNEKTLRFIILMIVALLIELTIYTATPDIEMSRKLLFYFRNQLPDGLNIDKLLIEFDKDVSRFKGADPVQNLINVTPVNDNQIKNEISIIPEPEPVTASIIDEEKTIPEVLNTEIVPEPVIVKEDKPRKPRVKKEPVIVSKIKPTKSSKKQKANALVEEKHAEVITLINNDVLNNATVDIETSTDMPLQVEEQIVEPETIQETFEVPEMIKSLEKHEPVLELKPTDKNILIRRLPSKDLAKEITDTVIEKIEQLPKQEPVKVEEVHAVNEIENPRIGKVSSEETINYRFGKTTEKVKNILISYIRSMMEGLTDTSEYPAKINDPYATANKLGIPDRVRDVLLKRLLTMKFNDVNFIVEDIDHNYKTNFNPLFLEEYMTEILKIKS